MTQERALAETLALAVLCACSTAGGEAAGPGDPMEASASDAQVAAAPVPAAAVPLGQDGAPGDTHVYEVRREHVTLDRRGRPVAWTVAEGTLRRTLLEEHRPGVWRERNEWLRYGFAEQQGARRPDPVDRPTAVGATFEAVPRLDDHGLLPDASVEGLPGPAGFVLGVLGLDAITWDGMIGILLADHGRSARPGSVSHREAAPDSLLLSPGTRYWIGETEVEVAGVTSAAGEPAGIIRFMVEGARLASNAEAGGSRVRIRGTETFSGHATVSLRDGRLLEGFLWGPLFSETVLVTAAGEPQEMPVSGVVQRVWVRESSAAGSR